MDSDEREEKNQVQLVGLASVRSGTVKVKRAEICMCPTSQGSLHNQSIYC